MPKSISFGICLLGPLVIIFYTISLSQAVDTECQRVKQRFSHIEKQAEWATKALNEERQRSQEKAETVANQVELMRKVSNLNVLTDSNKLLRDERDQLLNNKQAMESKIAKLESDIEPLQAKLRDLESQKETLTVERNTVQEEVNRSVFCLLVCLPVC